MQHIIIVQAVNPRTGALKDIMLDQRTIDSMRYQDQSKYILITLHEPIDEYGYIITTNDTSSYLTDQVARYDSRRAAQFLKQLIH
jgi:hypothetical protein